MNALATSPLYVRKNLSTPFDESKHPRADDGEFASGHGAANKPAATGGKSKRAAPGSQLPEVQKEKLREYGMTGTFPPADVPLSSIKFADLSKGAEDLKYVPLMSWNRTTRSGRVSRQYRYTQAFHDRNAAEKFDRVMKVEPTLPAAKKKLAATMASGSQRDKEGAAIASIIMETGLRPTDSKESVKHGHYGVGSILAKHVKIEGGVAKIDFIGKEGVRNQATISDPNNVKYLKGAIAGKSADEPVFGSATSQDALGQLKKATGLKSAKLKDLRTVRATQEARKVVDEFPGPPPPLTGAEKKDAKAIAKAILAMSGKVAVVLNNTATMARDNYIHPEVFKQWRAKLLNETKTTKVKTTKAMMSRITPFRTATTSRTTISEKFGKERSGFSRAKGLASSPLYRRKSFDKPGFTGIDAHGHKWVNGEQVAIGRDAPAGKSSSQESAGAASKSPATPGRDDKTEQYVAQVKAAFGDQAAAKVDAKIASLKGQPGSEGKLAALQKVAAALKGLQEIATPQTPSPKPLASPFNANAADSAHAKLQRLFDSALTNDSTFQDTDKLMEEFSKTLTVPQLKNVAKRFGIHDVGKSKKETLGKIEQKVKGRREFYDRTKAYSKSLPTPFRRPAPDMRSLADLYAYHLDAFGEQPPGEILHRFDRDLHGSGYRLEFAEGHWRVRNAPAEKSLTKSVRRAPKGGITINGKQYRGGQFIPSGEIEAAKKAAAGGDAQAKAALEKLDAAHAVHEERHKKKTEERQARGFQSADVLARTHPHRNVKLGKYDRGMANRGYAAIKMHHGEMMGHRLDELTNELHEYLQDLKENHPDEVGKIKQAKQRLRLYGDMLKRGQREGLIKDTARAIIGGGTDGPSNFQSSQRILTAREEKTQKGDPEAVPGNLRQHLTPEQVQGVSLAVPAMEKHGGFLLADSTGVGKTRQEIAMASILAGKGKKALLVSTAAILQPNWDKGSIDENTSMHGDSQKMGVPLVLNNGSHNLEAGQVHLTTYENLGEIRDKIDKDTHVIFDESHYIKNPDSQRGGFGKEISEKAGGVCYASATPADTPEDTAYLFRTKVFGDEPWSEVRKKFNVDKNGAENVLRTVDDMFGKLTAQGLMIRREISLDNLEVGFGHVELPKEAHEEIAKIRTDAKAGGSKNAASAVMSARLGQEKHKVSATVDHVMKELAEGRQAVVFVASINAPKGSAEGAKGTAAMLREHFAKQGIHDVAEYHSSTGATDDAVGKFNRGESKVLITTIPSGSTGINLDDTTGKTPRSIVVMTPPWTANENVQIPGRILRLTTKSKARLKYLFADTDVDRHNYGLLSEKMKTLGAVVEGELKRLDLPIPPKKSFRFAPWMMASPLIRKAFDEGNRARAGNGQFKRKSLSPPLDRP